MLDIIQHFIIRQGYEFVRLDGSTPQKQRQAYVDDFNHRSSLFIFLISTTAGGLGLNLTSANKVVRATALMQCACMPYVQSFNAHTANTANKVCSAAGQVICVNCLSCALTPQLHMLHLSVHKHPSQTATSC